MKKLLAHSILLLAVLIFSGCSVRHMYIIRNSMDLPIEITLLAPTRQDTVKATAMEMPEAGEIVPLENSKLTSAFVNKIRGSWNSEDSCTFVVQPGHSADTTSLIESLNVGRDLTKDFMGSGIQIRYGRSALLFGNNLAELHRLFNYKSFFLRGPSLYYLDLE